MKFLSTLFKREKRKAMTREQQLALNKLGRTCVDTNYEDKNAIIKYRDATIILQRQGIDVAHHRVLADHYRRNI